MRSCVGLSGHQSVALSSALWKTADRIRMPFGIIGRTGPGMRQVVGFGDRSTERGTFGANLGRAIVTNGNFTAYACDSAVTRPSSQMTLGRLVVTWRCGSAQIQAWSRRPAGFFQCFDTVGLVIWSVKIVSEMTYNVLSGTLSLRTTTTRRCSCSCRLLRSVLLFRSLSTLFFFMFLPVTPISL